MDKAQTELIEKWRRERQALGEHIRQVNEDLPARIRVTGATFDYDDAEDTLTISFGTRPPGSYAQGMDHVYLDLDADTDLIVGMTIVDFVNGYLKTADGRRILGELLPVLRHYHTLNFPPQREGTTRVAETLAELIPA